MAHMRHVNNRTTAPYNFVPLPDKIVVLATDPERELPDHNVFGVDEFKYDGYIEVNLSTLSPLFIRGTIGRREFDRQQADLDATGNQVGNDTDFRDLVKNIPDFFFTSDPDTPVIPGSSIRGMLRTLVEIITYSKPKWITRTPLIYRSVFGRDALTQHYQAQMLIKHDHLEFDYPSPHVKGGYLRNINGSWYIQPAGGRAEHLGETFIHVNIQDVTHQIGAVDHWSVYPQPVYVRPESRGVHRSRNVRLHLAKTSQISRQPGRGLVPATLVTAGRSPGPQHFHCAIFEPDDAADLLPISNEKWQQYREDSEIPRGTDTRTRPLRNDGDPLFYLVDDRGELIFFGPTKLFRLPYHKSPYDLIPWSLRQCPAFVDFAEALFGYVRDSQEEREHLRKLYGELPQQGHKALAYAGRVFVTDAVIKDNVYERHDTIVPKILATPKPTAFPKYLEQDTDNSTHLKHYDSNTQIRGYKLYWHQGAINPEDLRETDPDHLDPITGEVKSSSTQHTQIEPISTVAGHPFVFRVYFESLDIVELGALLWALTLPGFQEQGVRYAHKLGMGKALGLGSVKLEANLYLVNREQRYRNLFTEGNDGTIVWDTAVTKVSRHIPTCIQRFESFMLNKLELSQHTELRDVERIQMLLKILEWHDHPDRARIADVGWENRHGVLPNPLDV